MRAKWFAGGNVVTIQFLILSMEAYVKQVNNKRLTKEYIKLKGNFTALLKDIKDTNGGAVYINLNCEGRNLRRRKI